MQLLNFSSVPGTSSTHPKLFRILSPSIKNLIINLINNLLDNKWESNKSESFPARTVPTRTPQVEYVENLKSNLLRADRRFLSQRSYYFYEYDQANVFRI